MTDYELFLAEIRKEHQKSKKIGEQLIEARVEAKRAEVKRLRELVGENGYCNGLFNQCNWS